jgi:predicted nuclease with TOPRIM domain
MNFFCKKYIKLNADLKEKVVFLQNQVQETASQNQLLRDENIEIKKEAIKWESESKRLEKDNSLLSDQVANLNATKISDFANLDKKYEEAINKMKEQYVDKISDLNVKNRKLEAVNSVLSNKISELEG